MLDIYYAYMVRYIGCPPERALATFVAKSYIDNYIE